MRIKNPEVMQAICSYVDRYYREKHTTPSTSEIAEGVGVSKATSYRYLVAMNERGMLSYDGKTIVTKQVGKCISGYFSAPVVGSIRCGDPEREEESVEEYVSLPKSIFGEGKFYILRAKGDSMVDAGIEDEDLIVINKPAGMPIHPSLNNYTNSLANALAWYYQQQGKPFIFRCCNRLDRDTSGLTVVAKHLVSGNILSTMTKKKEVRREYLAVVRGHSIPESGTISAPLARKGGTIIERVVDFDRGEPAVTHYHLVREANGHSLVSLQLETGRTHQIRIHLKHLGFPLVGDYLYNPDMEYISRQALHSFRLSFPHPITGEVMDFTAPLPEDMRNILTERSSLR